MGEWVAVLVIVAANLILGWVILALFGRPGEFGRDWLERLVAAETLGVTVMGWLGLVLAEAGWFSVGRLGGVWLLAVLAGGFLWWLRGAAQQEVASEDATSSWVEYGILAGWLVVAGWLFFRPHEFIIGGADAGVYVNLAASIADSGGILIEEPTLAEVEPDLYPTLLRTMPEYEAAPYYLLPGFYVTGEPAGRVTPQFYPLHPVWQAVAYGLGGVRAALMMTGLWAVLGSLAVYLVARRLAGWPVAMLVLAGLSLNAMQVWFARYPTTEMLTQYLLWVGVWGLMEVSSKQLAVSSEQLAVSSGQWAVGGRQWAVVEVSSERGAVSSKQWAVSSKQWAGSGRQWAVVAGLGLGEVFLVRIDSYFLLAIPVLLGVWLVLSGRWRRAYGWFFGPMLLLTVHSFYHALVFSAPYFFNIFGFGLRQVRQLWPVVVAGGLVMAAGLVLLGRFRRQWTRLGAYRRPLLIGCIAAVLLLAVYGWFIRPYGVSAADVRPDWYGGGEIPAVNHENLVRLGWYLTPLGVWLAVAGTCLLIWRIDRPTVFVLGVGLFFSLFYLWRIQANPHQIYAMRRYVPAVLPFFMMAAAYGLGWLGQQKQWWAKGGGVVLALVWLGGLAWAARGFVSQVDYRGMINQVEGLNRQLNPDSVLLFQDPSPVSQGDFIGTPLKFLHGHEVYGVRDLSAPGGELLAGVVREWLAKGRVVYWIGDPAWLVENGFAFESSRYTISSQALEGSYEHKPTAIVRPEWRLEINKVVQ